jgi:hypothetical protein
MNKLVKQVYGGIPFFRVDVDTKRKRLLKNPIVIELIKGAFVAFAQGECPETFIKSMKR